MNISGPFMDVHAHILPGLDDGSSSMLQTANMLRQADEEGIRVIVATPHFGIRNPGFKLSEAEKVLAATQKLADEITPGMKLLLGNELYYTDGVVESLKRKEARTLGGSSYALVEFSTTDSYERICKCIREFTWNGYIPLIAHLERCRCIEGNVDAVKNLVKQGAVVQINCRSFMHGINIGNKTGETGLFRRKKTGGRFVLEEKSKWVRRLLEEGLVHIIASDCHDDESRRPVFRRAVEAMAEYCDEETLNRITRTNILHIIRNERIV